MKALGWYTIIVTGLTILAFILAIAGLIPPPPFTALEGIIWIVVMLPVIVLGILVIRKPK